MKLHLTLLLDRLEGTKAALPSPDFFVAVKTRCGVKGKEVDGTLFSTSAWAVPGFQQTAADWLEKGDPR